MIVCVFLLLTVCASANEPPVPSFTYSPQLFVVQNETISFNASESYDPDGTVATYVWDFGDGNTESTSQPVTEHSYLDTGNYIVELDLIDNEGLESDICFSNNVVILERGSEFTIKDGWTYEGMAIDAGYLFDVSVAKLPGGGYRLYGGDGETLTHEVVSYYSGDGLSFRIDDGFRLYGVGFMQYIVNLSDGSYRLYYTGGNAVADIDGSTGSEAIKSAISENGLNFTLEEGDRLFYDPGSTYESGGIRASRILELPDGSYRMYYHALEDRGDSLYWRVLSAVSTDGLNWTRESGVRLDSDDLCPGTRLHNIAPVIDSDGIHHLFVAGTACEGDDSTEGIFDTTSPDGLTFTVDKTAVVASYYTEDYRVAPHDPFVVNTGSGLRMYFGAYDGPDVIPEVSGIYSMSLPNDTLTEIVTYINSWFAGDTSLSDVVALISTWSV